MDPIAHTLFGATLAEAGLKRRTRYATATLLIGANLPDIDVIAGFWGGDTELYFRRGWTHGILALLVLPLLLAGGVALWHRWRGGGGDRHRDAGATADAPPFRPRAVLALACLGVLSHPLLDWLNTYGVRLLMPFDGRWFYGDTLFIVEPWFWLLMAAGVAMARSSTWRSITGWSMLALLTTAVVLGTNMVPLAVKLIWSAGIVALVALRGLRPAWMPAERLARAGLTVLLLYVGLAFGLGRMAETRVARQFPAAVQVSANPNPADPLSHRVVVAEPGQYHIVTADGRNYTLPREAPDAIVRSALASESIRGFVNWVRFPHYTVEDAGDRWIVHFQDLRYLGPDIGMGRGIGAAQVAVPKDASISE